jgi:hypothetical protein
MSDPSKQQQQQQQQQQQSIHTANFKCTSIHQEGTPYFGEK